MRDFLRMRCNLVTSARRGIFLLAAICLAGCASSGDDSISYAVNRSSENQPYPANYRPELLAFLKTYLNDPRGVREAALAEPALRTIRGRQRYVACLRFNAREAGGNYPGVKDRAVLYIDGRLDRMIEDPGETCAGAAYAPFPEMEKLTR